MIDLRALAREGGDVEGRVPVARFERLLDSLLEQTGTVEFSFRGERGGDGKLYVDLAIRAELVLECQRCLEPMEWSCEVDGRLLLLNPGELPPDDELEDDSADAVDLEPRTDLLALVEDEILLAFPLVPRHEFCEPPAKAGGDDEISPFAVLRQLRGKV